MTDGFLLAVKLLREDKQTEDVMRRMFINVSARRFPAGTLHHMVRTAAVAAAAAGAQRRLPVYTRTSTSTALAVYTWQVNCGQLRRPVGPAEVYTA